ncbi:MAG: YlbF family regulator [Defluviitaleaceae bacterium]|nr:YlbF family regulator [Defluviitaleaceae bacterium]
MQEQAVLAMVRFLGNTLAYQEVKLSVEALRGKPDLLARMRAFKQEATSGQMSQAQMDNLGREYQQLSQIPEAARYFRANDKYSEVVGSILQEVSSSLEQGISL